MSKEKVTGFHRWFLVGYFGGYLHPRGGGVMSSDKLRVVVGDFILSIFILDFCDGIVLGFFGGGHVTVVGVLEVGFSSIALIEVML